MTISPLDIQTIFVNVFAGNATIFLFVALIALAALAARFRMPNIIFGMLFVLFAIITVNLFPWFYALIIIIAGMILGFMAIRLIKT